MSMHIVEDEQRSDRRPTPMRPLGSGLEGASAALALLDDVRRHRLRRGALHLPARRSRQNTTFIHYQALTTEPLPLSVEAR